MKSAQQQGFLLSDVRREGEVLFIESEKKKQMHHVLVGEEGVGSAALPPQARGNIWSVQVDPLGRWMEAAVGVQARAGSVPLSAQLVVELWTPAKLAA